MYARERQSTALQSRNGLRLIRQIFSFDRTNVARIAITDDL